MELSKNGTSIIKFVVNKHLALPANNSAAITEHNMYFQLPQVLLKRTRRDHFVVKNCYLVDINFYCGVRRALRKMQTCFSSDNTVTGELNIMTGSNKFMFYKRLFLSLVS